MKTRPIIFSGEMVRAILDGRKTQTRRVVKPQPPPECDIHYMLGNESWVPEDERSPLRHLWEAWTGDLYKNRPEKHMCGSHTVRCPFGQPGDRLWVRETWAKEDDVTVCARPGDPHSTFEGDVFYRADDPNLPGIRWKPSIHMPRRASRLTLEVTDVRVERLQEISVEDVHSEGLDFDPSTSPLPAASVFFESLNDAGHIGVFANLWDQINGKKYPWESNPWVWVVGIQRVAA